MSLVILGERCPYCTKFRSPLDIRTMSGGAKICTSCMHAHEAAVLALSTGKPPQECSECHTGAAELLARHGDKQVTFSVIYEGGIYRFFCPPCADVYVTKRREFFKGTAYAQMKGLT